MAALIDAIDVKRKSLFEFENTPFSCLEAEVNTPTARGGQTLSVSVSSGDATLGLMGDTETKEGTNSFTAVLPKNGDYTFEVSNYGEKEIEVTVTVKIQ